MRYSQIRSLDISNGEGVGIALFVQGCHFHCKGCFNQETWDFDGGKEWNVDVYNKFIELANRPHIKRISILGGEPLADENIGDVFSLIFALKKLYPEKKIWVYTGYTFEEIQESTENTFHGCIRKELLKCIDVLCDGRFEIENANLLGEEKKWVGSKNQRIIDVGNSLEFGCVCNYVSDRRTKWK